MDVRRGHLSQAEIIARVLDLARRDSTAPAVIRAASDIQRGLPPRDELAETRAAWEWVKRNIRWIRGNALTSEQIQAPIRTLELGRGKCIDLAPLLGVLLTQLGHQVVFDLWDRDRDGFADHISVRDVTPAVVERAQRSGVRTVTRNGHTGVHLETTPAKDGDGNVRIFGFGDDVPNAGGGRIWTFDLKSAGPTGLPSRPMALVEVAAIAGADGVSAIDGRRAAPGQTFIFGGASHDSTGGRAMRYPTRKRAEEAGYQLAYGRTKGVRSDAGTDLALWRHHGMDGITQSAAGVAAVDEVLGTLAIAGDRCGMPQIEGVDGNLFKKLKKAVTKVVDTAKTVVQKIVPKPIQQLAQKIEQKVYRPIAQKVLQPLGKAIDKNLIRPVAQNVLKPLGHAVEKTLFRPVGKALTKVAEQVGLKKPAHEEMKPAPEPEVEIPPVPEVPVEPQAQEVVSVAPGAAMQPPAAAPAPRENAAVPARYNPERRASASRGFGLLEDLIDIPEIGALEFAQLNGVGSLAIADVGGGNIDGLLSFLRLIDPTGLVGKAEDWASEKMGRLTRRDILAMRDPALAKLQMGDVGDVGFVGPALSWLIKTAGPAAVAMLAEWLTGKIAGKKSVSDIGDIGAVSAGAFVKNLGLAAGMAVANDLARAFPSSHPLGKLARKFLRWSGHSPVSGVGELLAGVDIACCCDRLSGVRGVTVRGVDVGSFFKKLGRRISSGLKRLPATVAHAAQGVQNLAQQAQTTLGPLSAVIPGGQFLMAANAIAKQVEKVASDPRVNAFAQTASAAIRSGNPQEIVNAANQGFALRRQFAPMVSPMASAPRRPATRGGGGGGWAFGMSGADSVGDTGGLDGLDGIGAMESAFQHAAQVLGSNSRGTSRFAPRTLRGAGRKLARHRWGTVGDIADVTTDPGSALAL